MIANSFHLVTNGTHDRNLSSNKFAPNLVMQQVNIILGMLPIRPTIIIINKLSLIFN